MDADAGGVRVGATYSSCGRASPASGLKTSMWLCVPWAGSVNVCICVGATPVCTCKRAKDKNNKTPVSGRTKQRIKRAPTVSRGCAQAARRLATQVNQPSRQFAGTVARGGAE